jgi:hypothetical protein
MNRKIMFLALGANWGFFGASGSAAAVSAASAGLVPSKFARAIAPKPTPHCSKNQRRVTVLGSCFRYKRS